MDLPLPSERPDPPSDAVGAEGASPVLDLGELAHFFGYSHEILTILDGRGRVLQLSSSVERILGYAPEELVGRALLRLAHPDDASRVRQDVRGLIGKGAVTDLDCRVLCSDGRWLPMRWSISAQTAGGRIYGVGRDRRGDLRRRDEARDQETARLRLTTAAELHDGVLQTLTAAGLQLEVARRMIRSDPDRAEEVLARLAESVAGEQKELRLFVDELKFEEPLWADRRMPLVERLGDMLDRIRSIWGIGTTLEASPWEPLDAESERHVVRIIQEAVVNAARHGGASNVSVMVSAQDLGVRIRLQDDGRGFPFFGVFDDAALKEKRIGPVSLKRRVAHARGTMCINSTPEGAVLDISLPTDRGLA